MKKELDMRMKKRVYKHLDNLVSTTRLLINNFLKAIGEHYLKVDNLTFGVFKLGKIYSNTKKKHQYLI